MIIFTKVQKIIATFVPEGLILTGDELYDENDPFSMFNYSEIFNYFKKFR